MKYRSQTLETGRAALKLRAAENLTESELCARFDMSSSNLYRAIAAARASNGELSATKRKSAAIEALLLAGWEIADILECLKVSDGRILKIRYKLEASTEWRYETDPLLK